MTPEEFLKSIGTGDVIHNSGAVRSAASVLSASLLQCSCRCALIAGTLFRSGHIFSDHLLQVEKVLEGWGVDKAVSRAGLYHSIYGTEGFQASVHVCIC